MTQAPTKAVPGDMQGLIPHLVCDGAAQAIDFYVAAFGAVEVARLAGPDGKLMHAALRIGGAPFMLNDEFPQHGVVGPLALKGSPVTLHRYVEDVDAAIRRAADAGATVVMPAADMFWGDRYGIVQDKWGHRWSLATHLQDLTPEQMRQGMAKMRS